VEHVVIAKIVKARGIRGEVACEVLSDVADRFRQLNLVAALMPDQRLIQLEIERYWYQKSRVILKFRGIDTMSAAETLVGGRLVVEEAERGSLNDEEFFEDDLVGAMVISVAGENVGTVTSFLKTGGTDVLVVRDAAGNERLIPFADEICTEVDVSAKRITVDPPVGLLEL
jgi:16S rRNA processing protein RimM